MRLCDECADFSGEITLPEFNDGLKRLGIFLTNAEATSLLERFSIVDHANGILYKVRVMPRGLRYSSFFSLFFFKRGDANSHRRLACGF